MARTVKTARAVKAVPRKAVTKKKAAGPNWKNIRKLRNHLASLRQTKNRKFDMSDYLVVFSGKAVGDTVTVAELRKNGPQCGSAACLAGEAVIHLANRSLEFETIEDCYYSLGVPRIDGTSIENLANQLLGLSAEDGWYMFGGHWSDRDLDRITKEQAVRYLDKVLAEKNIYVDIYD